MGHPTRAETVLAKRECHFYISSEVPFNKTVLSLFPVLCSRQYYIGLLDLTVILRTQELDSGQARGKTKHYCSFQANNYASHFNKQAASLRIKDKAWIQTEQQPNGNLSISPQVLVILSSICNNNFWNPNFHKCIEAFMFFAYWTVEKMVTHPSSSAILTPTKVSKYTGTHSNGILLH